MANSPEDHSGMDRFSRPHASQKILSTVTGWKFHSLILPTPHELNPFQENPA
jgi:hypothetical protein